VQIAPNGRPPFRADHIGSLLRPQALRQAFRSHARKEMSDTAFRAAQDAAIRDVVKLQEECGLQVVTDGEFRRISYWEKFVRLTQGLVVKDAAFKFHDEHGHESDFTAPYAASKVSRADPITLDEYAFASKLTKSTQKITMPAPSTMHFYRFTDWGDRGAYTDPRAFFADLGRVYQGEIADLHKAGCRYVQLDDTNLAYLCDEKMREGARQRGDDPNELPRRYARLINAAIADRPAGMRICIHLCRGNFKSAWAAEGGYEPVAEVLFNDLKVDGYFLEYDDARSGDFAPLRFVPAGKTVVLGLVSTKLGQLEAKDDIKRRIDAAAAFMPLEQMCLSPQCGFSSTVHGNALDVEAQRAKLALVVETAKDVWGTA